MRTRDLPVFHCHDCGKPFDGPVWHCDTCGNHYDDDVDGCWFCNGRSHPDDMEAK